MKRLRSKFRLFFAVSIVLFVFILIYPLVVLLCFIVEEKVKRQVVELISKSYSFLQLIVWLKSLSDKEYQNT
jgi:hypothetical protein